MLSLPPRSDVMTLRSVGATVECLPTLKCAARNAVTRNARAGLRCEPAAAPTAR
jgi:hypothetical protein